MDAAAAPPGYTLLAPIGQGGMGAVWRARGPSGADVALKTVRTADPIAADALRREIAALADLDHPGIVKIIDHGMHDGAPWYAMELVPGRPLRALLTSVAAGTFAGTSADGATWWTLSGATTADHAVGDAPTGGTSLAITDALRLVHRLCAPLAWLHGEGIIHRDLKAENVIVTPDGSPVIVDLGLVVRAGAGTGREAFDPDAVRAAGTVGYMAPEQREGGAVDARTDLFALGCMLVEMVSGHLPGRTRPVRLPDAVPPAIGAIVERLVALAPDARYGSADAVAHDLVAAGVPDAPSAGPAPAPHLFRARVAGRSPLVRALVDRAGAAGVVLLSGASGSGKTRILDEIARASPRGQVLTGAATAARTALEALRRPIDQLVQQAAARRDLAERRFGERGPVLAPLFPAIATLPGQGSRPAPPELRPGQARQRLVDAVTDTLRAAAPVLVLIDDVDDADELVLSVLTAIAARPEGVYVVATCRTDAPSAALAALRASPGVETADVAPLDEPAIAAIVADMVGAPPPPEWVARLGALSGGNPFLVAEALRATVASGDVPRDALGRWRLGDAPPAAVPASAEALIARRIAGLDAAARDAAERAAVLGRTVPLRLLPDDARTGELFRRHVLESVDAGVARFVHDALRTALLDAMPAERRLARHRDAAGAIEAAGDPAYDALLAVHLEAAGASDAAGAAWERVANAARAAYAFGDAERAWRAALRLAGPADRPRLRAALLAVFEGIGQGPRILAEADAWLAEDPDALVAKFYRVIGLQLIGDVSGYLAAIPAVAAQAAAVGRVDIEVRARTLECQGLHRLGRHDGLAERYAAARERAVAAGLAHAELVVLRALALFLDETGRPAQAASVYAELLEREVPGSAAAALALHNRAVAHVEIGRLDDAIADLVESVQIARATGDRRLVGYALVNLGNACALAGDARRALAALDDARGPIADVGDERLGALATAFRGQALLEAGLADEALGALDSALAIADRLGEPMLIGGILAVQARAERLRGRRSRARAAADRALAILPAADQHRRGQVHAERAWLERADGRSGADDVAAVRDAIAWMGIEPSGALARALCALEG